MDNQNKMYIINKIFNNETIRTIWDKEEEKYFISVVDVVGVITESKDKRKYWNKLKERLKHEGNQSVTNCHQPKLKASDGKYYKTDVVDIEGMFRIIESIPSKNAEPIKRWLAKLGSERIDEVFDPSIAVQRSIELYRAKGYDEKWIAQRIQNVQSRKSLTDIWKENGVHEGKEFAILTNEIYKTWSGMTASEYKEYKGLKKESLRDNMDNIEISLTDISEEVTKRLAGKAKPQGLNENLKVARLGGNVAKNTRNEIENLLGESIVTKENRLNYKYINEKDKIELKKED